MPAPLSDCHPCTYRQRTRPRLWPRSCTTPARDAVRVLESTLTGRLGNPACIGIYFWGNRCRNQPQPPHQLAIAPLRGWPNSFPTPRRCGFRYASPASAMPPALLARALSLNSARRMKCSSPQAYRSNSPTSCACGTPTAHSTPKLAWLRCSVTVETARWPLASRGKSPTGS